MKTEIAAQTPIHVMSREKKLALSEVEWVETCLIFLTAIERFLDSARNDRLMI
jgi:hypothetical protein